MMIRLPPDPVRVQRILVIKLSALGDVVLSLSSFQSIRAHYRDAKITLLTTKPFHNICQATRCFDEIWQETRPKLGHLREIFRIRRRLMEAKFDLVIDLQGNDRTAMYFHLMLFQRPSWSGTVKGCDYYYSRKKNRWLHPTLRETAQLSQLGITRQEVVELDWLGAAQGMRSYTVTEKSLLLVAGCSPQHIQKQWPPENFAEIAQKAIKLGWSVMLIGTEPDATINQKIKQLCPEARDLTGQTNLLELAMLGRKASLALGNDTGPMHLLSIVGCSAVVLFGGTSRAETSAPVGRDVSTLQEDDIRRISVLRVWKKMKLAKRTKEFVT